MGSARKDAKSITYYLRNSICDRIDEFAVRTFRNKSQAVEMLLEIGLRNVEEMGLDQSMPERAMAPRRQPGELLDREPRKPGPKARKAPEPVAEVEAVAEAPKPRGRKPRAKVEPVAEVEAPKPRARKPRAKAVA